MKTFTISINIEHDLFNKCLGNNYSIEDVIDIISKNYKSTEFYNTIELITSIENHFYSEINKFDHFKNQLLEKYNENEEDRDDCYEFIAEQIKHNIEKSIKNNKLI